MTSDHDLGSHLIDRCWCGMVYNICCDLLRIRSVNLSDRGCLDMWYNICDLLSISWGDLSNNWSFNMVYNLWRDNLGTWCVNLSDGWRCDMANYLWLSLLLLGWLSNCRGSRVIHDLLRCGNHILGRSLLYRWTHRVWNNLLNSYLVLNRSFLYRWVLWMSHKFSGYNLVAVRDSSCSHLLLKCGTVVNNNWHSRLQSMEELVGL